jgi:hypothetical protein
MQDGTQHMPCHLSVRPELGHDLVEPDVGGLQGLVEDVEAGGAHVSPRMIAPWFCSGNALCRPQFQRFHVVFVCCFRPLPDVPASAGID